MNFFKRIWQLRFQVRFLLMLAGCAALCGCLRHEPRADLVVINGAEPESLDPQIITGPADMRISRGIFEGLMRQDPKTARAVPAMAERYEVSPDGLTYTFHLRTNLVWSTGEPIRAEDVAYSWLRAMNPATGCDYAGQFYYLKHGEDYNTGKIKDPSLVGIHAVDSFTVRVELVHPTAFFIELCSFPTLAVVPRHLIEKYGDAWTTVQPLSCNGAFELVAWRLNDRVRLQKNPHYWDAAHTLCKTIDLLPVGSPSTALNLYEQGCADIVWDKNLVPAELLDILVRRPDFHTFDYLGTSFLRFNVTRKPFDDPRVRRALGMAIDRQRIVDRITRGGERITSSLVPAGVAHYDTVQGLDYNPMAAKKLLAEAGFPDGKGFPRFEFLAFDNKLNEDTGVEIQQMWSQNLGISVEMRLQEWKVFQTAQAHRDYDVSQSSWYGDYDDAQTFLGMFTSGDGNNRTGWKNSHYDDLIAAAGVQTDMNTREKIFQTAETLLVQNEVPIVPIYMYKGLNYYRSDQITGIYPNLLDDHPLQVIQKIQPR